MIDFHSHILPEMDDGSRSLEMSVEMLRESACQGVTHICATPHFYADENSPEEFLARREKAVSRLRSVWEDGFPKLHVGAEVEYFEGITHAKGISSLKLEGTDVLLIEMPFMNWTSRMWRDVEDLASRPHTLVMLAHIERYLNFGAEKYLTNSSNRRILIQSNAESYTRGILQRHKSLKLLRRGIIDVIGSDCHNVDSRPQLMGQAREIVLKTCGGSVLQRIDLVGRETLGLKEY